MNNKDKKMSEERIMIQEAIERVRQMELCFDMLQKVVKENPNSIRKNDSLKAFLQILTEYYESGQWLQDYDLDEKGLFPEDLKRGVLAQDSVYDFCSFFTIS